MVMPPATLPTTTQAVSTDEYRMDAELVDEPEDIRMRMNTGSGEGEDQGPLRPGIPLAIGTGLAVKALSVVDVTFGVRARRVVLQNDTGARVTRSYTGVATAGSFPVPVGGLVEDVTVDKVSIWSTNAATVNDASALGIVVEAYT